MQASGILICPGRDYSVDSSRHLESVGRKIAVGLLARLVPRPRHLFLPGVTWIPISRTTIWLPSLSRGVPG